MVCGATFFFFFFVTSVVQGAALPLTQRVACVFKIKGFYLARNKYEDEDKDEDIYLGSEPAEIDQETSFLSFEDLQ